MPVEDRKPPCQRVPASASSADYDSSFHADQSEACRAASAEFLGPRQEVVERLKSICSSRKED